MNKDVYPAIFTKADGVIYVSFPEFGDCLTYGETIEEAYQHAVEVLSLLLDGEKRPRPTNFEDLKIPFGSVAMLITARFGDIEYFPRKKNINAVEAFNSALKKQGLTRYRLAKTIGVSESMLSRIASGKRIPSPETAQKIAGVLGFDWKIFFE